MEEHRGVSPAAQAKEVAGELEEDGAKGEDGAKDREAEAWEDPVGGYLGGDSSNRAAADGEAASEVTRDKVVTGVNRVAAFGASREAKAKPVALTASQETLDKAVSVAKGSKIAACPGARREAKDKPVALTVS